MVRRDGAPSLAIEPPGPQPGTAGLRLLAGWPDTVGYMQARTFATLKPETPLPVTPVPLSSMKV
jgi:hypothetical protein